MLQRLREKDVTLNLAKCSFSKTRLEYYGFITDQEDALKLLKARLTSDSVMAYFDSNKQTEVAVDASRVGLGAMLVQKDPVTEDKKIVCYASKALTDVERRYSQTEREALAIVWACEKLHLYVFGKEFKIITDHKHLTYIFNKSRVKLSARLELWSLRLQP